METFRDIQAVVFDIGGTLLDFDQPESLAQLSDGICAAYEHLDQAGYRLPPLRRFSAVLRRRAILALINSRIRGREPDTMRLLRDAHRRLGIHLDDAALQILGRVVYSPTKALAHAQAGTVEALQTLGARGFRLAIISNTLAPPPGLDEHLAAEGLLGFFPIRVYSCVVGVAKPDPRIFREALAALDVRAQQAVYVGDKPRIDIRGAQRVGMRAILRVRPGAPAPGGPRPDAVIGAIPELLRLLPEAGQG